MPDNDNVMQVFKLHTH